ncbi:MAG: ribosome biogenesis GTPase Der [Acidimicrobiales bacterium]
MSDGRGPARPVVAVVGRPNVGKSTLVNRILGRREAIVEENPGVTRDRRVVAAEWSGTSFDLVDTGGWSSAGEGTIEAKVTTQAERALAGADVVVLVVDATVGITDDDERVARRVRASGRPALVVANKVDSSSREADAWAFSRLGLGDPWAVSALHGRGAGDLLDEVVARLPEAVAAPAGAGDDGPSAGGPVASVAIVGRPNVGKSTLFNRLVGDERAIVHDLPGTTRDTIDTVVETTAGTVRFIDTAGLRRRAKESEGAEYYSLVRTLQAIDRADAALLVIDAIEGATHQDQRLAERIDAAGSPVLVVLNKWDLVATGHRPVVLGGVEDRLAFLGYAPLHKVSARTGLGLHRLLPSLDLAVAAYRRRIPTAALNAAVQAAQQAHPPKGARVLYATQAATDPPTVTLFTNRSLAPDYLRYLERRIREQFALGPSPLKLRVRRRG